MAGGLHWGSLGPRSGSRNPLSSGAPKAEFTLRRPKYASNTHLKWGSISDGGAHRGRGSRKIPLQALILTSVKKQGKNCASLSENLPGRCVVIRKHLPSIIKYLRMVVGIYSKTDLGGGLGPALVPTQAWWRGTRRLSVMAGVDHFLLVTSVQQTPLILSCTLP